MSIGLTPFSFSVVNTVFSWHLNCYKTKQCFDWSGWRGLLSAFVGVSSWCLCCLLDVKIIGTHLHGKGGRREEVQRISFVSFGFHVRAVD
jgi:hypothetical protein